MLIQKEKIAFPTPISSGSALAVRTSQHLIVSVKIEYGLSSPKDNLGLNQFRPVNWRQSSVAYLTQTDTVSTTR
jgi:hypothetical protein